MKKSEIYHNAQVAVLKCYEIDFFDADEAIEIIHELGDKKNLELFSEERAAEKGE